MVSCINCNKEVSTSFCGHCGQPNPPRKLSFGNMWYDFQSRVYGFDGMFPRTLRDLTIRPGIAAKEYIQGNRVKHYGPVGYFFLMITVFVLMMSMLEIDFSEFYQASSEAIVDTPKDYAAKLTQQRILDFATNNTRLIPFLSIPFIATMAWLFFRRSGYNFLEHAVIPFYVLGHMYWLAILNLLLFKFFGVSARLTFQFGFTILFFAFACSGFYTYNSKTKAFFKGLVVYLLGFFSFILLVILIGSIYVMTNPEIMELMKSEEK